MKQFYSIATCLLILLCACNDTLDFSKPSPSLESKILSRNTIGNISLPEGSTALFNISGNFELTNQILTYSNKIWNSEEPISWPNQAKNIYLTAIHPVLNEYSANTLYTDNKLSDILIAQDTLKTGKEIEITFKHLFSSLTIHLNETMQEELQEISLTVPKIVTTLQPSNGTYTMADEAITIDEIHQGASEYQFILPPMKQAELHITLRMTNGDIHSHSLNPHTFLSGYNYECQILKEDERPGIKTVEDLLAFSLLINKQSYTGEKSLTDFGEEVNGRTVYRLLSDITLTDEECKQFLPIGYYDSRAFQDIFDGEGHCIYNFTIPDKSSYSKVYTDYAGLFGHIGTNGCVKNLHLSQAKTVENSTCTRIGFIAAQNEGIIMNCHVDQSKANEGVHQRTGYICGQLSVKGYIVNCRSSNNIITSETSSYVGGLVGYANGTILNSYTHNNLYNLNAKLQGAGAIAGYSPSNYSLTIANCYTYNSESSNQLYALAPSVKNAIADNLFYNQQSLYNSSNSSNLTKNNVYKYDASFQVNGTSIITWMNDWIENKGKESYPDFTFRRWTIKNGLPTFE